ncbi:SDR family NAD(P)-dependent oxidoreductase [Cohnella algarum]|uniref:SDR family NAD(P)-dependent oxidoreductase n=1 Tax=Cohnella algarum TaxID=2044859 RepID=UPI001968657F|nr:SDR family NAD(P)-dependent oxidoreductase [Cohnella algarum]
MVFYKGKKILVTGGTGTIGQHLVRRLLQDEPTVIRVFSRDEHKQFEMQQSLRELNNIRYLIGDVRDVDRLTRAMEDIDYVFHLAAMKHVPACEYNPFEAVQTNVIGTQNVIQSALYSGVKKVLFTSTDKAISPTNTYGATKLMAEKLIAASEYQKGPKQTVFSAVRFGNVMGARGSVIPLFVSQILKNRSLSITDPSMLRYMMTPNQAIRLILEANERASGGEIFILKMPVIRLQDLAEVILEEMIKKYRIADEIAINEIGIRAGEKLYEELMTEDEKKHVIEDTSMYILPSIHKGIKTKRTEPVSLLRSFEEQAIHKELLRKWILEEGLLE